MTYFLLKGIPRLIRRITSRNGTDADINRFYLRRVGEMFYTNVTNNSLELRPERGLKTFEMIVLSIFVILQLHVCAKL